MEVATVNDAELTHVVTFDIASNRRRGWNVRENPARQIPLDETFSTGDTFI